MTMVGVAQAGVAWDVPVRLVPLRVGTDSSARSTVRVDPGVVLPGVVAVDATIITVDGLSLLERLDPVASGAPTGALADLLQTLHRDGTRHDALNDVLARDGSVPVAVDGTPFTLAVLSALARVPVGTRVTYAELAVAAGRPRAVRAAASVMARNHVPLVLPCHRVVPSSGGTGRYGWGEDVKVALLAAEAAVG